MRALFPREHGLWCWVGVPLLGALLLAPGLATGLGAVAILALFGAANAVRRHAWATAGCAGATGIAAGIAAAGRVPSPDLWLATLGATAAAGALALVIAGTATGRRASAATLLEVAAIGGFAAAGAGLAIAAGARASAAAPALCAVATWELIGLWWVRGQMARVLPGRTAWRAGPALIAGSSLVLGVAATAAGAPQVALVPALYLIRVTTTRPVSRPLDARRIGLSEGAWAAGAAVLAVVAAAGVA